jgi:hypothetical protein
MEQRPLKERTNMTIRTETAEPELPFLQAAYIVGIGLQLNMFDAADVSTWADRHIEAIDEPPIWLLELSTQKKTNPYDAGQIVLPFVPRAPTRVVCGTILALMPPLTDVPSDHLERYSGIIYNVVRAICDGDWSFRPLCDADQIHDSFELLSGGYLPPSTTIESIRSEMAEFFTTFSLPAYAAALSPIRCRLTWWNLP